MNPIPGDPITIETGKLSGTLLDSGVKAYLGVPFAAPPVRELRWHEPMPAKAWKGIYNADTKITNCYIALRATTLNHYFGEIKSSEDCLNVNIWMPPGAKAGDKLPVVVWIHGGGFQEGSINFDVYGGEPLAKKGVIFMGISYRVNIFGNLAHPELTAASPHHASGNYGLMDQIAGLKWIQRNIAAFGGDPGNVTVVGQSAGAMALDLLQVSPLAHGPLCQDGRRCRAAITAWRRRIWRPGRDRSQGREAAAGDEGEGHGPDAHHSRRPDHRHRRRQQDHVFGGPNVDGYVDPGPPAEQIYAAGQQQDVPLLLASVGNDIFSKNAVTDARTLADYRKGRQDLYGADATELPETVSGQERCRGGHAGAGDRPHLRLRHHGPRLGQGASSATPSRRSGWCSTTIPIPIRRAW